MRKPRKPLKPGKPPKRKTPLKSSTKRIARKPIKKKKNKRLPKRVREDRSYATAVRSRTWETARLYSIAVRYPDGRRGFVAPGQKPSTPPPDGSSGWQLDHVYPVTKGKRRKEVCTIERMSDPDNLEWITGNMNYEKGSTVTPAGAANLKRWELEEDGRN